MRFAKLRATSSIELIGRLGATIHLYDFSRVLGDPSQVYHLREGTDEVSAMATRRRFLGLAAATMISARADRQAWGADTKNGLPLRTLGHTGEKVSIVGIGGYHLARSAVSLEEGIRIVRT